MICLIPLCIHFPHHHRIRHIAILIISIVESILRSWLLGECYLSLERSLENRMLQIHAVGIGIQTKTKPVVLGSIFLPNSFSHTSNSDSRARIILWKILFFFHCARNSLKDVFFLCLFQDWWTSIKDGHVISIAHLWFPIFCLHGLDCGKISAKQVTK